MFVELLEKLRCPNEHAESPLIATASVTEHRYIIEGTLGCPVCHAEFAIREGALQLGGDYVVLALTADALSRDHAIRLAAQLGLDERGGLYALDVYASFFIRSFRELSPESRFIVFTGDSGTEATGVIAGHGPQLPLAPGSLRGIVLDTFTPLYVRSAVRALAPGGRLIAPQSVRPPAGITVIARDEREWVGEREDTPAVFEIRRGAR